MFEIQTSSFTFVVALNFCDRCGMFGKDCSVLCIMLIPGAIRTARPQGRQVIPKTYVSSQKSILLSLRGLRNNFYSIPLTSVKFDEGALLADLSFDSGRLSALLEVFSLLLILSRNEHQKLEVQDSKKLQATTRCTRIVMLYTEF